MIVLFTDFGADDVYVGQVKAALHGEAGAGVPIVDLLHRVPDFRIGAGAHLLDALQRRFARGSVFLAVVDPGVGSSRDAVVLHADDKWYVGPDNGLLSVVAGRAARSHVSRIAWRPGSLSSSFHGRDLFAPIAAWIAAGKLPQGALQEKLALDVRLDPGDAAEVIYVDHYGNACTGLRAGSVARTATLEVRGCRLAYARVFAEAPADVVFWYENSVGLIELAAREASAAVMLDAKIGEPVAVLAA